MGATLSPHLQTLVRIAQAAGTVVMRHYEAGCDARVKADRSPVTDADEEAETLILAELARHFPGVPVVAEEEAAAGSIVEAAARVSSWWIRWTAPRNSSSAAASSPSISARSWTASRSRAWCWRRPSGGCSWAQAGEGAFEISRRRDARDRRARARGRWPGRGVQPLASRSPRPTNCSRPWPSRATPMPARR